VITALAMAAVAFVPMDDRPVTAQLPALLGRIAGVRVAQPPARDLGRYLTPGNADAVGRWLQRTSADSSVGSFVVSTDMLAYGGLIASRVPGPSYENAVTRLQVLQRVRVRRPHAWIAAFGTVMRLAPTGVPAGSNFFAAYPAWTYVQRFANVPDPLGTGAAEAARLRALAGEPLVQAYLATRARDLAVDRHLLRLTANETLDRLALGQDDAGAAGLHVNEVRLLQAETAQFGIGARTSIEPGADELGMALVAGALARRTGWTPRVAVRYSTPGGGLFHDPLEFAPISDAIDGLIGLCGGIRADTRADIELYVRVPATTPPEDAAFEEAMATDAAAGRSVALADLSFLRSYGDQAAFARRILASGTAAKLDAYAAWNTNANTVGTALAEAVSAGAGRRAGTYDALAHRTFTFMRFLDDYAFHDDVRPSLNAWLDATGISDHTLLDANAAAQTAARNRALLWNEAGEILRRLDPGYHIAAMTIALPWDRTFETRIDAGLAPAP
jgi:hypothetical protein